MRRTIFSLIQLAAVLSAVSLSSCNDEKISPTSPASTEEESNTSSYEDDFSNSDSTIIGKWLLSQVSSFGYVTYWSEKDVEYLFRNEGLLSVKDESREDGNGIFLKSGEYQYSLDEKTGRIIIDNSTYGYQLKGDELFIDTGSAWDAPIFTFKRIK